MSRRDNVFSGFCYYACQIYLILIKTSKKNIRKKKLPKSQYFGP
jgi:hypothetical protein